MDTMSQTVFAVRGAAQLESDSQELMRKAVIELVERLLYSNSIDSQDIVSIQFTQTADIRSANPARELRTAGFSSVPLFCAAEPEYPDSLPLTVRVLLTFRGPAGMEPVPEYIGGARTLRQDIQ